MNLKLTISVGEWLHNSTLILRDAGIDTARLDALVLLEDALHRDRAWLLAHLEAKLRRSLQDSLYKKIARRSRHVPLSYIRHQSEFYGRAFYINRYVLEPRPESESIIDALKSRELLDGQVIIDVGTGSGALGITAKLELPSSNVIALDIDRNCLRVAQRNARQFDIDVTLIHSNLLSNVVDTNLKDAVLLCNLPYVPEGFSINLAASHEPKRAIYGGSDGLALYRMLFQDLAHRRQKPAYILTEALPPQHSQLADIAAEAGFLLSHTDDFIQGFVKAPSNSTA